MYSKKTSFAICSTICRRGISMTSATQLSEKKMMKLLQYNSSQLPEKYSDDFEEMAKKNRMFAQYNYREWRYPKKDLPICLSATMQILDKIENHTTGRISKLKTPRTAVQQQTQNILGHRKIKKYIPSFHRKRFPEEASHIYRETYSLLNSSNWTLPNKEATEERLHELVSEFAYPDMVHGLEGKTFKLSVFDNLEPPKVVTTLALPLLNKENYYGQVTVRFHTSQTVVMYDRFGRLLFGSPDLVQSVLEYVVFERHLSDFNGKWRIHGKLAIPENAKHSLRTVSMEKPKPEVTEQIEWHKNQHEDNHYKWDAFREVAKRNFEKQKKMHRGVKWWSGYRKWYVLNVKRTPKTRMFKQSGRRIRKKREAISQMRKEGKLPKPHKN